jgi:hypothetical protein
MISLDLLLHFTQIVCDLFLGLSCIALIITIIECIFTWNQTRNKYLLCLKVFTAVVAVWFILCSTIGHFCGVAYPLCKFGAYIFLFFKNRLVRPLSVVSRFEKVLLVATVAIVPFSICCGIWVEGKFAIKNETVACYPHVPPILASIMIGADVIVSLGYIILFVEPLRNLAQHEAKYHDLIKRNFVACVITILGTVCTMAWIIICDYDVFGYGDKIIITTFCGGVVDVNITIWTIIILSKRKLGSLFPYSVTHVTSQ